MKGVGQTLSTALKIVIDKFILSYPSLVRTVAHLREGIFRTRRISTEVNTFLRPIRASMPFRRSDRLIPQENCDR